MLTMGRSLSEASHQPHRYKLKNKGLPTFGNPTVPISKDLDVAVAPRLGGKVERERADSEPMKTGIVAGRLMPVAPISLLPRVKWTWKVNLFRSAKPAPCPIVQGELCLDKVKPVRNDLSDSDLELVAPPKRTVSAQQSVCIESQEIPVVKARPILTRIRGLFQRNK